MGIHTGFEVIPFTLFLRRPGYFSQSQSTRKHHIFQMLFVRNIFCPGIGLYSHDVFTFFGSQGVDRNRIITIQFLNRSISADSIRLCFRISLIEVKIHIITRCHHHVMSHTGRLNATTFATPGHNGSLRSKATFQYLIPADQLTAFRDQMFLCLMYHITLQFIHAFHAILFHQSLTFRTGFPGFVPSYMNILGWKKFDHFIQYVFHKGK